MQVGIRSVKVGESLHSSRPRGQGRGAEKGTTWEVDLWTVASCIDAGRKEKGFSEQAQNLLEPNGIFLPRPNALVEHSTMTFSRKSVFLQGNKEQYVRVDLNTRIVYSHFILRVATVRKRGLCPACCKQGSTNQHKSSV